MTAEQIAREIVAARYGNLMIELASALAELTLARDRIKELEAQMATPAQSPTPTK